MAPFLPAPHRELPYFDNIFVEAPPLPLLRMEAALDLDGLARWEYRYHNDWSYIPRYRHPMYIDIYRKIMSLLAKGGRGYFQHRYVHTVIVNRTSGERVFIDGNGGYYTLGDNVTRQLPARERQELFAILGEMPESYRYCRE